VCDNPLLLSNLFPACHLGDVRLELSDMFLGVSLREDNGTALGVAFVAPPPTRFLLADILKEGC